MAAKNEYMVYFDFTTFRGSYITGRSGQLNITTEFSLEQLEDEEIRETIKQLCINFVYSKKPKWNIFMLDIKNIEPIKAKHHEI